MAKRRKTLRIGMIGYPLMGRAYSNAWQQVNRFFDLPAEVELAAHQRRAWSVERIESISSSLHALRFTLL